MKKVIIIALMAFCSSLHSEVRLDGDNRVVSIDLRTLDQLKKEISYLIDFKGSTLNSIDLLRASEIVSPLRESRKYIVIELDTVEEIRFKDAGTFESDSF